jgi:hypothetical protein
MEPQSQILSHLFIFIFSHSVKLGSNNSIFHYIAFVFDDNYYTNAKKTQHKNVVL